MKNAKNFKMMICSTLLLASSFGVAQQKPFNVDVRQQLLDQKNPLLDVKNLSESQKLKSYKLSPDEKKDLEQIFEKIKRIGGNSGGGGDEMGLDFHQVFGEAVAFLKTNDPKTYKQIEAAGLEKLVQDAEILVLDENLPVDAQGFIQNSAAYNNPELGVVLLNRGRMGSIRKSALRGAIALHEIASLAGLEKTGKYPISGRYAALKGLAEDALPKSLAVNRVQQIAAEVPKATPFDILEKYFEEAGDPVSVSELHHGTHAEKDMANYECRASQKMRNGRVGEEFKPWRAPSDLLPVRLMVLKATQYEPAIPSNGPLFPGKPANELVRSGITLCDYVLRECGQQFYRSFEDAVLEVSKTQITQTYPAGNYSRSSYTYEVRKNNGLIAFRQMTLSKYENELIQVMVVGYCYPKEKK